MLVLIMEEKKKILDSYIDILGISKNDMNVILELVFVFLVLCYIVEINVIFWLNIRYFFRNFYELIWNEIFCIKECE